MLLHLRPAGTVTVEDLHDDLCLYRTDSNEALILNQTAADIWRLADGTSSAETIVGTLARAYGTEPQSLLGDVEATLTDLVTRGYLTADDADLSSAGSSEVPDEAGSR